MRETTAEVWIGPDQSSSWAGTRGGINATHLMLLRENDHPAWMLLPGNLYDSKPPLISKAPVWVPTLRNPLEDALLFFAVVGAKIPEVRAVFSEFEKATSRNRINLAEKFPRGVPRQIVRVCRSHLRGWHVVVSAGRNSLVLKNLDCLDEFPGLSVEVRTTSVVRSQNADLEK